MVVETPEIVDPPIVIMPEPSKQEAIHLDIEKDAIAIDIQEKIFSTVEVKKFT